MSFRPFTSESYTQDDRPEAWRDVLSALGLQPAAAGSFYDGHATASHRSAAGVALTRIAAGSQTIAPLPQPNEHLPIVLLSMEDGVMLRSGAGHRIVPAGHLLLLPRYGDWSVVFQRDMRAAVLAVASDALHGRFTGKLKFSEPRVVAPGGFADVFSHMLDATARTLENLSDVEWSTVAQSSCRSAADHGSPAFGTNVGCQSQRDPASDLPDHRTQTRRRRPFACARRPNRRHFRALSAKAVRRRRRQLHPLCEGAPAAARLGRSVQPDRGAPLDLGDRVSLRLCRFRAFQPGIPSALRHVAARVPTARSRTNHNRRCGAGTARLATRCAGTVARASAYHRKDRSHPSLVIRERPGAANAPPSRGRFVTRALGLFQPLAAAADGDILRRHYHHRDTDAARLRRSRADDHRRRRRRKRVRLDERQEERGPARRRSDGRKRVRARRRRRLWRTHLHRPGRREGRAARRRAGGAHPRHGAAGEPQRALSRPRVRLQRRGLVGLSLQRVSRRRQAAGRRDDLRDLCRRRDAACPRALFLSLAAADRSVRRRAQDLRLPGRSRRGRQHQAAPRRAGWYPHPLAAAFRRHRGRTARG